jgi:nitrate reductase / nitrite oxidoreductase, beta subunit
MAKVKNWQLGREMEFPYEEAHPKRQFAAVFNINRCIACQTCSMACKSTWTYSKGQETMWWNNVETKPYGGYPNNWDVKLLSMLDKSDPEGQRWDTKAKNAKAPYGKFEGKTIFEAAPVGEKVLGYLPEEEEWRAPNLYEDTSTKYTGHGNLGLAKEEVKLPEHKAWFFYLQRICNHCSYPACLAACPRKAIYKRPEDGIVLVDQKRCRGYRKCMEACPYKKTMYNTETRVTEKCIACYPRVEGKDPLMKGKRMETRCMSACVGQIRLQGLVDIDEGGNWKEDPKNPLYYLVNIAKVALPLYPQFGTEPNVYYIPPRWVPRPYLYQMFGPGVDEAIERYARPDRELLAVLQLFRRSQEIIFQYDVKEGPKAYETTLYGKPFSMYNDTVIAYGENKNEIFRTNVEEPLYVRPKDRTNAV